MMTVIPMLTNTLMSMGLTFMMSPMTVSTTNTTIQNKNMIMNGLNIIMGQTFEHLLNLKTRMTEKQTNP
jgi:hypothetical protein